MAQSQMSDTVALETKMDSHKEQPENPELILSEEMQLELLTTWAEEGPQGPIED